MTATRIVLFRPTLGDGGADRITLTLLEHLERARYQPTLVLVRRAGALIDRVPSDVPVIDLGRRRLALAAPALARVLRAGDPDVVLCTAGSANVIAVAAHRLARSRARLVLSERNAVRRPGFEWRNRFEVPLKRALYPRADAVTAVSDGVARDLRDVLGLAPERVLTVYNPVVVPELPSLARAPLDHPWFQPLPQFPPRQGDAAPPVIVAVGRLVAQKDYPTMLAAFALLRARRATRLVILGIGPEQRALEALATKLGIADDVAFIGFDPNPFRWMARAHLLVQSSVAEGLPGTLIQSMACGTPVVATDCDHGPREVVTDGADGFLVPVGDSRALADRANQLLGDAALRDRMSRAALAAAQRYTIAASLHRYQDAIDGRSQR
jgi:glycosyltransferase involved in cell wall biosynthesis